MMKKNFKIILWAIGIIFLIAIVWIALNNKVWFTANRIMALSTLGSFITLMLYTLFTWGLFKSSNKQIELFKASEKIKEWPLFSIEASITIDNVGTKLIKGLDIYALKNERSVAFNLTLSAKHESKTVLGNNLFEMFLPKEQIKTTTQPFDLPISEEISPFEVILECEDIFFSKHIIIYESCNCSILSAEMDRPPCDITLGLLRLKSWTIDGKPIAEFLNP